MPPCPKVIGRHSSTPTFDHEEEANTLIGTKQYLMLITRVYHSILNTICHAVSKHRTWSCAVEWNVACLQGWGSSQEQQPPQVLDGDLESLKMCQNFI